MKNAKALIFAGLFFDDKEAETWFLKGKSILERELSNQVLLDGGHCELSPMYHSIVLEDLIDMYNIFSSKGRTDLRQRCRAPRF